MPRYRSPFLTTTKWAGTVTGVLGAVLIALNIGAVVYGFMLFLASSLLWSSAALAQRELSLVTLQVAFTVINVIGIVRWMS